MRPIQLSIFLNEVTAKGYLLVSYVEVDVEAVHHFDRQVAQQVGSHLNVSVPELAVFRCIKSLFADLNPGRVERHIFVLETAAKNDVFKPLEAGQLGEAEETGFLRFALVGHG
mgnify:CR=1 FL=1